MPVPDRLLALVALPLAALAARPAGAAPGPTAAAPPPPLAALPLGPSGSAIVVASGTSLETRDPDTGRRLGSVTPFPKVDLVWQRFLRRGRFLLAEGWTEEVRVPMPHRRRGLVLIDDHGRVLWARLQPIGIRIDRRVYLDDDGRVAFDSSAGPGVLGPDGGLTEAASTPAGPVLAGVLPLVVSPWMLANVDPRPRHQPAPYWMWLSNPNPVAEMPPRVAPLIAVHASIHDGSLYLDRTIDPAPEVDEGRAVIGNLARLPLPAGCRGAETELEPVVPSRLYRLDCVKRSYDDYDGDVRREDFRQYTFDARARRFRPIPPPTREPAAVLVTPDGGRFASVSTGCQSTLYQAAPGGAWRRSPFAPLFGRAVHPAMQCGRLTLRPGPLPSNGGCGRSGARGPDPARVSYVQRADATWIMLPYEIEGACSSDGARVAVVPGDTSMLVVGLDRESRIEVTGLPPYAPSASRSGRPVAWLP